MAAVQADLVAVNSLLRRYVAEWDSFVDAWLVIKVADPAFVYTCACPPPPRAYFALAHPLPLRMPPTLSPVPAPFAFECGCRHG